MGNRAMAWASIIIALFLLLTRLMMPTHALSLNGTIEAFQHIGVGILIGFIAVAASVERWVIISCLVLPTAFEIYKFMDG